MLGAIFAKVDRVLLARTLRDFDPACGVAMVGVFLATLALFARRWWVIATALGLRAPFRQFVRVLWISQYIGEFGPALVVGELARFQLMRNCGDAWLLAASQAVDRFSGKAVLLVMVTGLLPFYLDVYSDSPVWRIAVFALILIVAVGAGALVFRRFWPMARSHGGKVLAVCNPLEAPHHFGYSLLIQMLLALNFALAALGLGLGLADGFRTVWLLGLLLLLGVGSLPGLVSDWGKREAVAVILLAPAGLTPEQSLAVSLLYGALHLLTTLPGALLWVGAKRMRAGGGAG